MLRSLKVREVYVDESRWEGDERVDRADEVPATRINSVLVDTLCDRVVPDAILNRLNRTDTEKADDESY